MRLAIFHDDDDAVHALRRVLLQDGDHQVLWVAHDEGEAVRKCTQHSPDLLLMRLALSGSGGLTAIKRLMRESPCPILLLVSSIEANGARVFEAMGEGGLDVVELPATITGESAARLMAKLGTLRRLLGEPSLIPPYGGQRAPLLAVGASAGGPAALASLLSALPVGLPVAIVLVQHVDAEFAAGMADWLSQLSTWPVRLAREGDRPMTGSVLLAGTNEHLVLTTSETLGYTAEPIGCPYRPSVDALFSSIALRWRGEAIGVLLTGMGRDGALGLKEMREKGHYTIAQDKRSSAVYGMPKAAAQLQAAVEILPLEDIAPRLRSFLTERSNRKMGP